MSELGYETKQIDTDVALLTTLERAPQYQPEKMNIKPACADH